MTNNMKEIIAAAEEAERILNTSSIQRHATETHLAQKKVSIEFLQMAKKQATAGVLDSSIEDKIETVIHQYELLPPPEQQPAFKCVSNHKDCVMDSDNLGQKVLCAIALVICFAKEVIQLV